MATPMGGWYHASKFAVEGLSDSLRLEVKQFGIDVVVVEPGGIETEWGGIAASTVVKASGNADSAYKKFADIVSGFSDSGKAPKPIIIAELIKKIIEKNVLKPAMQKVLWLNQFYFSENTLATEYLTKLFQ